MSSRCAQAVHITQWKLHSDMFLGVCAGYHMLKRWPRSVKANIYSLGFNDANSQITESKFLLSVLVLFSRVVFLQGKTAEISRNIEFLLFLSSRFASGMLRFKSMLLGNFKIDHTVEILILGSHPLPVSRHRMK